MDDDKGNPECCVKMQDPQQIKKAVGARVRQLRRRRGWNQEELAYQANIGRSFVGAIETGAKDLRISTLVKLANVFNISVATLLK